MIIVVSTIAVEATSLGSVEPMIRGPLVLWFCLVCTGMAWVQLLRLGDPVTEAVAAVALSIALTGIAAAAFLYAGHWLPSWTMVALEAITLFAVAVGRLLTPP